MDLFALSAEDKQLTLTLNGEARVQGDRLMIQRALSNLLSNAIRHSPAGAHIALRVEAYGNSVSLSVSNPGPGIEVHHLPHLFERFYRVDSSRARTEGGCQIENHQSSAAMCWRRLARARRKLNASSRINRPTFVLST